MSTPMVADSFQFATINGEFFAVRLGDEGQPTGLYGPMPWRQVKAENLRQFEADGIYDTEDLLWFEARDEAGEVIWKGGDFSHPNLAD